MSKAAEDAVEQFIEQMGLLAQQEHGPRIAGRIFGLMVVENGPFGLQEMADRLHVSKASISTNVRMLAERGMLRRVARPGDRQDYYELVPKFHTNILDVATRRIRYAAEVIAQSAIEFPAERPDAKLRITELADFYKKSADFLAEWADSIKKA